MNDTPPVVVPASPSVDALHPVEVARRRIAAAVVFVAAASLLSVAWWLSPSPNGFGTHLALGLPPCTWPARFGVPCPSCGMTTAFALAAKGRLFASFATQPMGCLLAVASGMTLVASAWTLASGRTVWPVCERLWNARAAWILGIAALLAWGYKAAAMSGWIG